MKPIAKRTAQDFQSLRAVTRTHDAGRQKMSSQESCEAALGTAEILEDILEYLPSIALYLIQRVNKRFRDVILGSSRLQRIMFLRTDDRPVVRCDLRYGQSFFSTKDYLKLNNVYSMKDRHTLTPVTINPNMLRWQAQYKLATHFDPSNRAVVERGETLRFHQSQSLNLQNVHQHHSIMDGYLSDPHCRTIEVRLTFSLGPGLPVFLTVSSVIESETPLTIGAIMDRSLGTDGEIWIKWSVAGKAYRHLPLRGWLKGTPWHLMGELRHQFGFDFFFVPASSSFLLCHTLALTDEQRASLDWTLEEHKWYI